LSIDSRADGAEYEDCQIHVCSVLSSEIDAGCNLRLSRANSRSGRQIDICCSSLPMKANRSDAQQLIHSSGSAQNTSTAVDGRGRRLAGGSNGASKRLKTCDGSRACCVPFMTVARAGSRH
jgi:hypothetical protein